MKEANEFYESVIQAKVNKEERQVILQAAAGLLWSKQFYHYIVEEWLRGDPAGPTPPSSRSWDATISGRICIAAT